MSPQRPTEEHYGFRAEREGRHDWRVPAVQREAITSQASEDQRLVTEALLGELPTQGIYSVEVRTLHSTQQGHEHTEDPLVCSS